jgi:hypothetical protein
LCGCGAFASLIDGRTKLRTFQSRVLRRIFRPRKGKMAGGWSRLHNDDFKKHTSFAKYY